MNNQKAGLLILRLGIAGAFLYAGLAMFIEPNYWLGYFPKFIRDLIPNQLLLLGFGSYEILLSIWIISKWKIVYSASLACLTLLGIISFNFRQIDIIFRDISIIFSALALTLFYLQKPK